MGPGGELRLGMGVIVISGIKQNCTVTIMNNKSVQKKILKIELLIAMLDIRIGCWLVEVEAINKTLALEPCSFPRRRQL